MSYKIVWGEGNNGLYIEVIFKIVQINLTLENMYVCIIKTYEVTLHFSLKGF